MINDTEFPKKWDQSQDNTRIVLDENKDLVLIKGDGSRYVIPN